MTQTESAKISPLAGVNVMIMGPTGTGKTHSIGTLVDSGLEVFYFAYEAGTETLLGYWTDRNLPLPKNLHICTVKAATASFTEMADSVNKVNALPYDTLKKFADPHRSRYNQLEHFLRSFNDVKPDNEDKSYGSVDRWGTDKAIVIDGLTGLSSSALKAVVGGKFDKDQKDWGLAQSIIEGILEKLTNACRCHFVLISHIDREVDAVLGGTKIMPSAPGVKLAPKLPPMFSDVILAERKGSTWTWNTASSQADVKTRNLPIAESNPPDFKAIIAKWKSRGGVFETPA